MSPSDWITIALGVIGGLAAVARFLWTHVDHKARNIWQVIRSDQDDARRLWREVAQARQETAVERAKREALEEAMREVLKAVRSLRGRGG